jgi:hypothetical protein
MTLRACIKPRSPPSRPNSNYSAGWAQNLARAYPHRAFPPRTVAPRHFEAEVQETIATIDAEETFADATSYGADPKAMT